jgi:hypothetical protein
VKLYIRRTAEWDDMSVMARGIANELLKYAKNDGSLCRTKGRVPALAVAMVLKPKADELDAVQAGAEELIEDGYLVVADGFVCIKNYEDAQERRSPEALRQKRHRDRNQPKTQEPKRDIGCDISVTQPRDSRNGLSQGSEIDELVEIRDPELSADADIPSHGPLFEPPGSKPEPAPAKAKPEAVKPPLPFGPDEAVQMLTEASAGRFVASKLNRGHSIAVTQLIRKYPDRDTWMRVGSWIGAGGDSWMREGADIRLIGSFDVWEARSRASPVGADRQYKNFQAPRSAVAESKDVKL